MGDKQNYNVSLKTESGKITEVHLEHHEEKAVELTNLFLKGGAYSGASELYSKEQIGGGRRRPIESVNLDNIYTPENIKGFVNSSIKNYSKDHNVSISINDKPATEKELKAALENNEKAFGVNSKAETEKAAQVQGRNPVTIDITTNGIGEVTKIKTGDILVNEKSQMNYINYSISETEKGYESKMEFKTAQTRDSKKTIAGGGGQDNISSAALVDQVDKLVLDNNQKNAFYIKVNGKDVSFKQMHDLLKENNSINISIEDVIKHLNEPGKPDYSKDEQRFIAELTEKLSKDKDGYTAAEKADVKKLAEIFAKSEKGIDTMLHIQFDDIARNNLTPSVASAAIDLADKYKKELIGK